MRRKRLLSLEELIYISLIEYPFYYSFKFNSFTEIENVIDELYIYRNNKKNLEQIVFKYWGSLKDYIKSKSRYEKKF
jgi:capsule polysaccharide export protein KpsC/LpsZ